MGSSRARGAAGAGRAWGALRALAALALGSALGSCGTPTVPAGPGPIEFTVAGMSFRLASGATRVSAGLLELFLSDQVDTCQAIHFVPVGTTHILSLRVNPASGGATTATVVAYAAPPALPGPGEADGRLVRATGGTASATLETAGGSVAWTADAGGGIAITALDVGFAGTTDRMSTGEALHLPACP